MSVHTDILSDRMRAAANASSVSVTQDFNHLLKRRGIINFQSTANRKNVLVKPKKLTPWVIMLKRTFVVYLFQLSSTMLHVYDLLPNQRWHFNRDYFCKSESWNIV